MTTRMRRATKPCPICGEPPVARYRPFCSAKCADIDLGRWLNNQYRIPTEEPVDGPVGEAGDSDERDG
jgi:uncharacterized protein